MTIYKQLEDYCECVKDISHKDVDELVDVVSRASCWCNSPCETFLKSERREVVEIPKGDCCCNDNCNIIEYKPFYHPFDVNSFTFSMYKQTGITEEEIPTEIAYSDVDGCFKIQMPCNDSCGCESTYKLVATYDAGYELIPECLLPVFCEIIDLIQAKNTCDCDSCNCGEKNPNNEYDAGEYPVGDLITPGVKAELANLLTQQYIRQIGLISLCDNYEEMWAIIE